MVVQKMTLDKELGITGYSVGWVLDKLDEHCDDYVEAKGDKKVVAIEANDVSAGKGYMSRVFITTVTFDDQTNFTLAMKVPTIEIMEGKFRTMEGSDAESTRGLRDKLIEAHGIECDALTLISTFKDFPAPKLYYAEKSDKGLKSGPESRESLGVIMMTAVDGASMGIVRSVTKEQSINVARDFATLHDHIAQCSDEEWKSKVTSKVHWDKTMFDMAIPAYQKIGKMFPELTDISTKIQNLDWVKYALYAVKERPAELNACTFVHGDAWTNNVMFRKNPDGSVGNEVLAYVDYQISCVGNPAFDIARFLCVCADADVRREAEPIVLKAYYDHLTHLFEKRGAKVPFSLEDVHELYDLAFFHQCTQSVLMAVFIGSEFLINLSEEIVEAQVAKLYLRSKFALLDAEKIYKRRNMIKTFSKVEYTKSNLFSRRSYNALHLDGTERVELKRPATEMVVQELKLDQELDITGYSVGWVLDKLDQHCDDYLEAKGDKKVVAIEANDVSEGKGYLSRVFITTVTFEDQTTFALAMKVPTFEIMEEILHTLEGRDAENVERLLSKLTEAHNNECETLTLISTFKDFPAPKLYYAEKTGKGLESGLEGREAPGVIMMNALDGATIGLVRSVTKEHCISLARDFATLHDHVAQCPDENWKDKFTCEMHWDRTLFDMAMPALEKIEKAFPELTDISTKMQNLDWVKYAFYALRQKPSELNACTLVHGDAWTNNVMFKKNPDGSVGNEILAYIDYQVSCVGSPLFDMARFMCVCADADVRRDAETIALKAYYDHLTHLFEKRGAKVPYSLEDVHELYDLAFLQQCTQSVLMSVSSRPEGPIKEEILEAQTAKLYMRAKFNLLDAEKIYKRRNIGKTFNKVADTK